LTVHLVGAGPGDPELLTVKAARLLSTADVVVHDRLVSEATLALVPERCVRIDAGKAAGWSPVSQAGINALLVTYGRRGGTVVRLKGGDPYVFGRGGEEAAALIEAGVDFESHTYEGAPHSFFDRTFAEHQAACDDAWGRMLDFIARHRSQVN